MEITYPQQKNGENNSVLSVLGLCRYYGRIALSDYKTDTLPD